MRKKKYNGVRLDKPYTEQERLENEKAWIRKKELRNERFSSFLGVIKFIFFSPLIKLFELLNGVMKIIAGASAFGFIYGIYEIWNFFELRKNAEVIAESVSGHLHKGIAFCIFPFIAYFLVWLFEKIADEMRFSLDNNNWLHGI